RLNPVGLWRTIDDATGKPKALVRITERDGTFFGRIEQIFDPDPKWDGLCSRCRDERKDQPVIGMTILRNLREEGGQFSGGDILDPERGQVYRCRVRLIDGGQRLEVRGFIGITLFGRTQIWAREM